MTASARRFGEAAVSKEPRQFVRGALWIGQRWPGAYDWRVDGLRIGEGSLAGKGVYATRGFAAGETVVDFELAPLTREEFAALAVEERMFVHSYAGRRWLYPPPARWVNHADAPSCCQDFERSCDVARRPIAAGDAITIDARKETDRELSTFLDAFVEAHRARDHDNLARLLSPDVVRWEGGRQVHGSQQTACAFIAAPARPLLSGNGTSRRGAGKRCARLS